MQLRLTIDIKVDEAGYALDYSLDEDQVADDAVAHIPAIVREAIELRAQQLGTFEVAAVKVAATAEDPEGAVD